MLDLPAALSAAFAANATLAAAFPGTGATNLGFRWGEAPESMPVPFVVGRSLSAPLTHDYATHISENIIEFAVVGVGLNATRILMRTFITAWDAITVTLDDDKCYGFYRDTDPVPDTDPEGQDEQRRDVWVWRVQYTYFVQP